MSKKTAHKAKKSSPASSHGAQGKAKSKGSGSTGKSWNKVAGAGMTGSKTKDGCFPKALTLLLPFIAVGAYFLIRS